MVNTAVSQRVATSVLLQIATKLQQCNVFTPVCDSVHRGLYVQGDLCPMGSLSKGVSVQGDLCWGVSVQGVSVQGGLFPGCLSVQGGLCLGGSLSTETPCMVTCGWYASYWNAFLSLGYVFIKCKNNRGIVCLNRVYSLITK